MAGPRLSLSTLLVADYDEAVAFFVGSLGFALVEDTDLGGGRRWVVVAPAAERTGGLLLARAVGPEQVARIGDQTGGRVAFFVETDDSERDHRAFSSRGVRFVEEPRREAYGTVAVFEDLHGNLWDLIQPA